MFRKKKSSEHASLWDYGVIVSPLVTEKTSIAQASGNWVAFKVHPDATKTDIRGALERVFKVDVKAVRTIRMRGKPQRTARSMGKRADWKKAYVRLAEGQRIDLVEGM